eukprot:6030612-Karenia_brevis.AAC.1
MNPHDRSHVLVEEQSGVRMKPNFGELPAQNAGVRMKPQGLHVLEDECSRVRMKPEFCERSSQCETMNATNDTNVCGPVGSGVCHTADDGYPVE